MLDEAAFTKATSSAEGAAVLQEFTVAAADVAWDATSLKDRLEEIGTAHGLKLNKSQAPIRLAVLGRPVGPPLFESLEVLGRDVVLARLRAAIERV